MRYGFQGELACGGFYKSLAITTASPDTTAARMAERCATWARVVMQRELYKATE